MESTTINRLQDNFPAQGTIEWLCIRPVRVEPVKVCTSVEACVESGLIGDHFSGKPGSKTMVSLIQQEHIQVVGQFLGREVDPALLRRNIVVSGINLNALKNKTFKIGDAVFEGTTPCPPCSRMETNLGEGGYNAMRGHGGINARVIKSGEIQVGDKIIVLADSRAEKTSAVD